ncbi:hypothetical protein DDB_G0280481 [Dictyostelium discoideum AX4]|uniref:Protein DENND6 homolog n=1 Tax=Dictyostelium discoideum TaxID=44689 RepID=F116_DICDI|nr:hypothetical protein DDB_G0280481 [Dictyostelium discoideum AX4]Q54VA9.1 RecName: Full=Protein DENND6 homolog [Dictyostelium discoideum]EAL67219.1 hypothetical protein DDB_G0280481 [Dictyostelium discoideum AX4]|eukprot:XP_641200.1 hypothetical protein DDB_G0280481 [Dictyostelium discoideum AX4]
MNSIIGGTDPLSMIFKEEEIKKQQILLEKEEKEKQEQQQKKLNKDNIFKLEEEGKKLELSTKVHIQHPNISTTSDNNSLLDPSNLTLNGKKKKWINSFCIINFDLEIGQVLDYSFPQVNFKEEESTNLCFLSFPDSNSHLQGDIIYSFKLKETSSLGNGQCNFQYGYVFFRQEKDSSISRGYLQKSVVLLSDESFVGLFKKVMEIVGPLYFDHGNTLLEVAYQNIMNWPELKLGQTYELPILGYILTFHVPHTRGTPHIIDPVVKQHQLGGGSGGGLSSSPSSSSGGGNIPTSNTTGVSPSIWSEMKLVSNLKSIDIYGCFKSFTTKLWMLWELVLLGHPLLVISPNPPMCSDSVLALVSLISPLHYCGDYRPYFTIHDTDFHKYTSFSHLSGTRPDDSNNNNNQDDSEYNNNNNNNGIPPSILGVTNPFFLKALGNWPNILTIGTTQQRLGGFKKIKSSLPNIMSKDLLTRHVLDNKEKILSEYKPFISPDKSVLKKITESADDDIINEVLRTHFLQLTQKFLIPLERYFSLLLPLAKTISIFQRPPRLKPFIKEECLNKIMETDERFIIDNKSKEIELYKQFLDCVNFKQWLDDKRAQAIKHLNILYRKAILDADIHTLLRGKPISTATDLLKRVEDQLILEENLFQTSKEIKDKFKSHIEIIRQYKNNCDNNNENNNNNILLTSPIKSTSLSSIALPPSSTTVTTKTTTTTK